MLGHVASIFKSARARAAWICVSALPGPREPGWLPPATGNLEQPGSDRVDTQMGEVQRPKQL